MKTDICEYVEKCYMCKISKVEQLKIPRLLQYVGIPNSMSISMDIIVGLPKNQSRHDNIFVVVYRLTKQVHFLVANSIMLARYVARLLL
jgi:hypothetical protein